MKILVHAQIEWILKLSSTVFLNFEMLRNVFSWWRYCPKNAILLCAIFLSSDRARFGTRLTFYYYCD